MNILPHETITALRQYRDALLDAAHAFAPNKFEVTHSEYFHAENGRLQISLCMDFYKPFTYSKFSKYLQSSDVLEKLSPDFDAHINFNYGHKIGFSIFQSEIRPLTAKTFREQPCEGRIGYNRTNC